MPETGYGPRKGAFLLISAEQLSAINRRYGFYWGEEALRLIAATIRAAIRADDIVGRLADSEFAVFLPDASESSAFEVGQRIRERVADVVFTPKGGSEILDVIVGGIIFEGAPGFDTMFRAVEQPLSDARRSGQVVLSRWNPEPGGSEWPASLS
jgi:diguanylate cyclase (GGDEF)-like protein